MDRKQRSKWIGIAGTLLVHVVIIAFLLLAGFTIPVSEGESGIPVMLGTMPEAAGGASSLVEVDVLPQEAVLPESEPIEQKLITQKTEETVALQPVADKKTEEEAAKKKLEEAKAERKRRMAEETARRKVAGAFGKGAKMDGSGDNAGIGSQGSLQGNTQTGAASGSAGYGTFDLGGRSIGKGGLPKPVYNVQDEGKVVVTITVNPAGRVIATSINRQTNTVNPALRKAAEDAAKKAYFNAVQGVDNQTGTITYYFNLK